jgi:hypothetical protein
MPVTRTMTLDELGFRLQPLLEEAGLAFAFPKGRTRVEIKATAMNAFIPVLADAPAEVLRSMLAAALTGVAELHAIQAKGSDLDAS